MLSICIFYFDKPTMSNSTTLEKIIGSVHAHIFFGYYDKNPFSKDNEKMLACIYSGNYEIPNKNSILSVGYFDVHNKKFNEIGQTSTWNWQQGCRLQWYGKDNKSVIYNKLINEEYGSVIVDINTKSVVRKFRMPIFEVSKNGKFALTFNYKRFGHFHPGYGYFKNINDKKFENSPKDDGLWLVNMNTGKEELLITLKKLAEDLPEATEHRIGNVFLNKSDRLYSFVHYYSDNKLRKRRLVVGDIDGNIVAFVAPFVTHHTWYSDRQILAFIRDKKGYSGYVLYDIIKRIGVNIAGGVLNIDGHPTVLKDKKFFLTDTYPSKILRKQNLYLYDMVRNKKKLLYRNIVNRKYSGELRCDFHPRLSYDEKFICIDDIKNGKRNMIVLEAQC